MPDNSTALTQNLRQWLTLGKDEFGKAIRGSITPDLLIRATLTYAQKSPKVFECSKESIAKCLMDCAALGLLPDGTLGTAYLVPYGNTCTLIIGYRGMMELARRSGALTQIEAQVVREGDVFQLRRLSKEGPMHEPKLSDAATRKVIGVYAVAHFHNGETQLEWMDLSEIEAIRNRSRAGNNGPWKTDFAEMAKKTVVRRLMKYLPLTPEMAEAFDAADREFIQDADVVTPAQDAQPEAAPKSKAGRLAKSLEHKPVEPASVPQDVQEGVQVPAQQAQPVAQAQSSAAPTPVATSTIEPDVLTVKTQVAIKMIGSKPWKKLVGDMDDAELSEALEFARANVGQGVNVAHNKGAINLITAEMQKPGRVK